MKGYRLFLIYPDNSLHSIYQVQSNDWKEPNQWSTAKCYCSDYYFEEFPALEATLHMKDYPNTSRCGFYAFKCFEELRRYLLAVPDINVCRLDRRFDRHTILNLRIVPAKVELAGIVLEGESGFRASKSKIISVYEEETQMLNDLLSPSTKDYWLETL